MVMAEYVGKLELEEPVTGLLPVDKAVSIKAEVYDDVTGEIADSVLVKFSASPEGKGVLSADQDVSVSGVASVTYTPNADIDVNVVVSAKTVLQEKAEELTLNYVEDTNVANTISEFGTDYPSVPSDGTLIANLKAVVVGEDGTPAVGVSVEFAITKADVAELESLGSAKEKITVTTIEGGVAEVPLYVINNFAGIIPIEASIEGETGEGAPAPELLMIVSSEPLIAPIVLNAHEDNDTILDEYDLQYPVVVTIPFYAGAAAGDVIKLNWGAVHYEVHLESPQQLPLQVEVENPEALKLGKYNVFYELVESSSNSSISSNVEITVLNLEGATRDLPRPTCEEAEDDNYINIADASNGVIVEISYAAEAGDFWNFYWRPVDESGTPVAGANDVSKNGEINSPEEGKNISFKITADKFFPNDYGFEGTVNAFYSVQRGTGSSLKYLISKESVYRIDTVSPGGRKK